MPLVVDVAARVPEAKVVIVGGQTNDYLICVATGKVIEFSSEKLRKLRDEICREHGFEAVSHQFHIFGLSPEGRAAMTPAGACSTSSHVNWSTVQPSRTARFCFRASRRSRS